MDFVYLLASFAVILAGALLFTNAVEWIGHRLELGEGAVGSLLAAVGTAMPETLIAIVALIGATKSEDVAIGAIVGAPFLLATLAMGLVGLTAYIYRRRRSQGIELRAHVQTLDRDLVFFLVFFGLALALGFDAPEGIRIGAGVLFFIAYPFYVWRTLVRGGEAQPEETLNPLIMERRPGRELNPGIGIAVLQFLVGLGAMVGGAHLFVEELLKVADDVGVEAIVLSLILAPLATELPEKVNSFFWVREGKDSLALGNITGAMVFQSTIPVGIGLLFTDWDLSGNAAVSVALGLAGGVIAYWALRLRDRFELPAVLAWISLYAAFIVVVAVSVVLPHHRLRERFPGCGPGKSSRSCRGEWRGLAELVGQGQGVVALLVGEHRSLPGDPLELADPAAGHDHAGVGDAAGAHHARVLEDEPSVTAPSGTRAEIVGRADYT